MEIAQAVSRAVARPGVETSIVPEAAPAPGAEHPILQHARTARGALAYAGDVTPLEAAELIAAAVARLVDVRTPEERKFVGFVPDSVGVAWMTGTSMVRNPRFVRELEARVRKDEALLFLCRSGNRSAAAAEAAARAGFRAAFRVLEGFEGDLDAGGHRGTSSGWRFRGLPWKQE